MAPTLYLVHPSPPVRSVLMTAKSIGLDLKEKEVNILAGEHLQPDYLEMNPQHTVPTLEDDDGFVVWDSHAIMSYLVERYAKDDALYPKDLKKRAIVDQRLYFDSGVAFAKMKQLSGAILFEGKNTIDEKEEKGIVDVYALLESFLDGRDWMAGDSVTIADYSLINTVKSLDILVPVDDQKFPKVAVWMTKCEQLPEFQATVKGYQIFKRLIEDRLI